MKDISKMNTSAITPLPVTPANPPDKIDVLASKIDSAHKKIADIETKVETAFAVVKSFGVVSSKVATVQTKISSIEVKIDSAFSLLQELLLLYKSLKHGN